MNNTKPLKTDSESVNNLYRTGLPAIISSVAVKYRINTWKIAERISAIYFLRPWRLAVQIKWGSVRGYELRAVRDYAWKLGISSSDITIPTSLCNMITCLIHKSANLLPSRGQSDITGRESHCLRWKLWVGCGTVMHHDPSMSHGSKLQSCKRGSGGQADIRLSKTP